MYKEQSEELWRLLSDQKFDDVLQLFEKYHNPELVNAANDKGMSPLMVVLTVNTHQPLIKYLICHPNLDFKYRDNSTDRSNIKTILSKCDTTMLEMVIQNPKFYDDGQNLSYELAKCILEDAQSVFERRFEKDPNSELTKRSKISVDSCTKKLAMVRDVTIRHAIKTDDRDLFDRLENAGGDPSDYLSDGVRPRTLLTKDNPNLTAWFNDQIAKLTNDIATNPHSLFNRANTVQECDAKIAQLQIDRTVAIAKIYAEAAESRLATFNTIASFTN
ncbi:MAG: hypothetical protein WC627_13215 [Legionella sp.]|jgi:hypothetical protein